MVLGELGLELIRDRRSTTKEEVSFFVLKAIFIPKKLYNKK